MDRPRPPATPSSRVASILGRRRRWVNWNYYRPTTPTRRYVNAWGMVSSDTIVRVRDESAGPGTIASEQQPVTTLSRQLPSRTAVTSAGFYQFGPPPPQTPSTSQSHSRNVLSTQRDVMTIADFPLFSPMRRITPECRAFRGPLICRTGNTVNVEQNLPTAGFDAKNLTVRDMFRQFAAVEKAKDESTAPQYAPCHNVSTDTFPISFTNETAIVEDTEPFF